MTNVSVESLKASEEDRVPIHSADELEPMRHAGFLAARTLDFITPHVKPGISTGELDRLCDGFIRDHGAIPAPLGYRGYPKSICTSINHVVCHGIPSDEKHLREGDVLNIDVTVIRDGWFGDTSRMFYAGSPSIKARRLCAVTYEAMMCGIETVRPGATTGDIGHAIQKVAEGKGYKVVRDFCGHGLGRKFHQPPSILHFGRPGTGLTLTEGMFFTIEPMINVGAWEVLIKKDGWTAITRDRSLSAQFEHTIAVTADGFEILTLSPLEMHQPPYL